MNRGSAPNVGTGLGPGNAPGAAPANSLCPPDRREVEGMEVTMFSERTLAETIDHLNRRGFTGHFGVVGDDQLREFGSGQTFHANELRICDYFRFEGVADPGDMAIVYTIETRTGVRGTLVDACGVYSNPAVSEFVARVAIGPAAMSRDHAWAA